MTKRFQRITAKHSTKKRQRLSSLDIDEQPKTKDRASIRLSLSKSKGISSSKLLIAKTRFRVNTIQASRQFQREASKPQK